MTLRPGMAEYLMEAAALGVFMLSACVCAWLLEDPASVLRTAAGPALSDPLLRRTLMAAAMGLTAVGIFQSPWAARSGAQINPAVTLTFWRLGRIGGRDAAIYAIFQTAGGTLGVILAAAICGPGLAHPLVNYAATVPGPAGAATAFAAEIAIAAAMMTTVLGCSSSPRTAPYGGYACAALLALCIAVESPLSGTSLNPARTFASAVVAGDWRSAWLYFVAPPLGMLAAAEAWLRLGAIFPRTFEPIATAHTPCRE